MILVLNCGSQSIKWKLFQIKQKQLQERDSGEVKIKNSRQYKKVLEQKLKQIKEKYPDIAAIGHRVVHGGEGLRAPIKITDKTLKKIKKYSKLAPLHNPYNVLGIGTAKKFFKVNQVAVFDTGFYKDLSPLSYTYALAGKIAKKFAFRRYGFHGISHQYVAEKAAEELKKPLSKLNLITCHLGGGSSITAIKKGKAIETSMGFTPLEGLAMMTRCGDIDPGIIIELSKRYSWQKLEQILNHQSGLKGICGCSDMLTILNRVERGDKKAKLALEIFCYRIQKYIGAYYAILKTIDALIFTGAIGFGSKKIRTIIAKDLSILKKVKILAIKTDEELAIAKHLINN